MCDSFGELASENAQEKEEEEQAASKITTNSKIVKKTLECVVKSLKALPQIA